MNELENLAKLLKEQNKVRDRRNLLEAKANNEKRFLEQTGCGNVWVDWLHLPDYVLLFAQDGNVRFVTNDEVRHDKGCFCQSCLRKFFAEQTANIGPGAI